MFYHKTIDNSINCATVPYKKGCVILNYLLRLESTPRVGGVVKERAELRGRIHKNLNSVETTNPCANIDKID